MKRWEEAVLNRGHLVADRGEKTQDELNDDSDKIIFGCIETELNDLIAKR
jgi:hypothetical protein